MLRFGSEAKPYAADVAVSVLLLWLALLEPRTFESRRRAPAAGTAGAVAVRLSQPAVFVAITLLRLVWSRAERTCDARLMAPVVGSWSVSAVDAPFDAGSQGCPEGHHVISVRVCSLVHVARLTFS